MKIGVLVSGRGSNLQSLIDNAAGGKLKAQIAVVISDVESAAALERARKHGIESLFLNPEGKKKGEYFEEIAAELKKRGAELVVLAGFMRVVKPELLREFPDRVINIHPALLPAFPGLRAQKQALDHGAKTSGCTVHFVTPEVDCGPIILQKTVPVEEGDDEDSLSARILKEEHKLLPKAVELIAEGRVRIADGGKVSIDWNGFKDEWK